MKRFLSLALLALAGFSSSLAIRILDPLVPELARDLSPDKMKSMTDAAGRNANPAKAVELVYLETFTRRPGTDELAEAREIIAAGKMPADGLADLRWAMLNSHEFRYLP